MLKLLGKEEPNFSLFSQSFPCGSAGKESTRNVGYLGSIPGPGKIRWRRERLPTPVFRPGEFHGLYSPRGCKQSDLTEQRSLLLHFLQQQEGWGDFSGGPTARNPPATAEDLCSTPGVGRSPGEGRGYPLQYSGLENSMDCIVHGVAESRPQLRLSLSLHSAI